MARGQSAENVVLRSPEDMGPQERRELVAQRRSCSRQGAELLNERLLVVELLTGVQPAKNRAELSEVVLDWRPRQDDSVAHVLERRAREGLVEHGVCILETMALINAHNPPTLKLSAARPRRNEVPKRVFSASLAFVPSSGGGTLRAGCDAELGYAGKRREAADCSLAVDVHVQAIASREKLSAPSVRSERINALLDERLVGCHSLIGGQQHILQNRQQQRGLARDQGTRMQ